MRMKAGIHILCFVLGALLFLCTTLFAASGQIRILHMNDFHGFATPQKSTGSDEMRGGIAYCAWLTQTLKNEKPALMLAAGDMIQGNTWTNLFQGKPVIEVMNTMGFDAMVVGNHEFDFGQKTLKERIKEASFPILGANVRGMEELRPYTIKEVGGIKVGIIGVVTEDTAVTTHPANVNGLAFLPVAQTVETYVKELRPRVDLIIVLSHIGYNADMMLANSVKGIDVIVGGHSHTKTQRHMIVGDTVIVQAWEHSHVLGVLDITVDNNKITEAAGRLEEIKPDPKKSNETVLAVVDQYTTRMNAMLNRVIGEAAVDLDGEGPHVRTQETNLGDLVADMLRERSGADAAIINGGGIRTSIGKGDITVSDVYNVLPFNNYLLSITLTGDQIKRTLEYGVSAVETQEGRFPQVSGISFTYAPKNKAGSRVCSVTIKGKPLEPDRLYAVATNDFLAAGGDGYQVFREAMKESPDFSSSGDVLKGSRIVFNDAGALLRDAAVEYITARQKIAPAVEGRIKEAACNENLGE